MITCNAAIQRMRGRHTRQNCAMYVPELEFRGLPRTVITYNVDISACEKGQPPQRALQILG